MAAVWLQVSDLVGVIFYVFKSFLCASIILDALQSRMFRNFPAELLVSLALEPLTANFHKWSLSVKVSHDYTSSISPVRRTLLR